MYGGVHALSCLWPLVWVENSWTSVLLRPFLYCFVHPSLSLLRALGTSEAYRGTAYAPPGNRLSLLARLASNCGDIQNVFLNVLEKFISLYLDINLNQFGGSS